MFDARYFAFLAFAALLVVSPGATLAVVTETAIGEGRLAALCTVLGVGIGNSSLALASALGLSVVFARWPSTLQVVRTAGAIYLAAVAILPEFMITGFKVQALPWIGPFLEANLPKFVTQGLGVEFMFGGTSILIVVGVAMDTMQQIEAQLVMRHYDGFMRRSRIRGRRG